MEEVTLRPLTLSDTNIIVRWRNSDAVRLNMYDQRLLTAEQHRNYYLNQIVKGKVLQYVIEADSISVGTIYCRYIDPIIAELGVFLASEKQKMGYGSTALNIFLELIRKTTSIEILRLKVLKTNVRAIRLYSKAGFKVTNDQTPQNYISMSLIVNK